jgi:hypothetical protein
MVLVFISHSKYDIEIVEFFRVALKAVGLQGKLMEYEDTRGIYAEDRISDIIKDPRISCVIVLLGENIVTSPRSPVHTRNWVNFEVGVAAAYKKAVWVFEEYGYDRDFPIPFVSDYCRYYLWDDISLEHIGQVLVYKLTGGQSLYPKQCGYCYARFYYWNSDIIEHCPVCRQPSYKRRNKIDLRLSNVV